MCKKNQAIFFPAIRWICEFSDVVETKDRTCITQGVLRFLFGFKNYFAVIKKTIG